MSIFNGVDSLQQGIGASWKQNSVILDNIANVDTPNFKASDVQFETLFKDALENEQSGFVHKKTRKSHMDIGTGDPSEVNGIVVKRNTQERMDGNNVDIDREMSDFAKNVIYYNALLRKINGQFSQLRTAIKGQ